MVDIRFHARAEPQALDALLAALRLSHMLPPGALRPDRVIAGAAELDTAGPEHVALAAHKSYGEALRVSRAGVVVASAPLAELAPAATLVLVADKPHDIFLDLLEVLHPARVGLAETGEPVLEDGVVLAPGAVLGPDVTVGAGTVIGANTVIGAGVAIGRDCVIGPNVTIECAYLGDRVVVHAGARIGTEGFGWLDHGRTNRKIPQLGRVIVQDRVEIGANTTIDRGALGDTLIGEGTKIDNLVQIGHNCRIGRNCLIAAMSGLSGTTVLGDGVLMGGGVGTSGHLSIGAGSVVHGRAAVTKDWPAGSKLAGAPAQDIRDFWRELATVRRLTKESGGT